MEADHTYYDHVPSTNTPDLTDAATPSSSRRPPPTPAEWDHIKPIFTDLYINQGKRLRDVQSILLSRHNFHATPKMYKSRITKWHLKKYVKTTEKEDIVTAIKNSNFEGEDLQSITFDGRPARLDLVRRYCKRTGAHPDIANALPTKTLQSPLRRNTSLSTSEESASSLSPNTAHGPSMSFTPTDLAPTRRALWSTSERVAWQVQQYMEWLCAPQPASSMSDELTTSFELMAASTTVQSEQATINANSFFESILLGLEQVSSHQTEGWQFVHKACETAKTVIKEQYRGFLRLFIVTFSDERWKAVPELHSYLLNYLTNMTSAVLGDDHELANILRVFSSDNVLGLATRPVLKAIVDVLTRRRPELDDELYEAQRSLMDVSRIQGDFQTATQIGEEMRVDCQNQHGAHHDETRRARRRLADTLLDQGLMIDARQCYQETLSECMSPPSLDGSSTATIDESTIFALQAVCHIDQHRRALDPSLTTEQVIDTVLTELGLSPHAITACVAAWVEPLTLRQRYLGSNRCSDRMLTRWAIARSS